MKQQSITYSVLFVMVLLSFLLHEPVYGRNIVKVSKIEFSGLKYISKYEVLGKTHKKVSKDSIIIDLDSLRKVLNRMKMVHSFQISHRFGTLSVRVVEREVALCIALKGARHLAFFELDSSFNILSKNRVRNYRLPVIFITRHDVVKGRLSKRVRRFGELVLYIRKNRTILYRELDEVHISGGKRVSIRMRGRKTVFKLLPTRKNLMRLRVVCGFLDRQGSYPEEIRIDGDHVFIRK